MKSNQSLTARLATFRFVALGMLVVLLSSCAWLDAKQRNMIYRPTLSAAASNQGLRASDQRYFIDVAPAAQTGADPERVEIWWLPHADSSAPTVLYCHGTFRHVEQNLPKINALREAGFSVLAIEYRGWGQSSAITPSEKTIMYDAQLGLQELIRREPRAGARVIFGHSMGSGVAVGLASDLPQANALGGVILESAFTSFSDIAGELGWYARWLSWLNNERFASLEKIQKVKLPLLMLHGRLDTTVSPKLGRTLFDAANQPKSWVLLQNGRHSDLHQAHATEYQAAVQQFIHNLQHARTSAVSAKP
jgi:uncharacterized protein